jgi:hypothetical protein
MAPPRKTYDEISALYGSAAEGSVEKATIHSEVRYVDQRSGKMAHITHNKTLPASLLVGGQMTPAKLREFVGVGVPKEWIVSATHSASASLLKGGRSLQCPLPRAAGVNQTKPGKKALAALMARPFAGSAADEEDTDEVLFVGAGEEESAEDAPEIAMKQFRQQAAAKKPVARQVDIEATQQLLFPEVHKAAYQHMMFSAGLPVDPEDDGVEDTDILNVDASEDEIAYYYQKQFVRGCANAKATELLSEAVPMLQKGMPLNMIRGSLLHGARIGRFELPSSGMAAQRHPGLKAAPKPLHAAASARASAALGAAHLGAAGKVAAPAPPRVAKLAAAPARMMQQFAAAQPGPKAAAARALAQKAVVPVMTMEPAEEPAEEVVTDAAAAQQMMLQMMQMQQAFPGMRNFLMR